MEFTYELVPLGEGANFHFPNAPGENFRQVVAQTPNRSSPLQTKVRIEELHHGKMVHEGKSCEATLILFRINFQSRLQGRRYTSLTVRFEFFDEGGNERDNPEVVKISPDRKHWLNKTTYGEKTTYGARLGARGGADLAGVEASGHWDRESEKPLHFKATLSGSSSHSTGNYVGGENCVEWAMEENTDEEEGVPSFLQAAVLLKRAGIKPFYTQPQIKSEVDKSSAVNRWLCFGTDEDKVIDPITFTPGRNQLNSTAITGITESDLEHMDRLPIHEYCQVNLSEEDILLSRPTPAGAVGVAATGELGEVAAAPATATPLTQALRVNAQRPTLTAAAEAVAKAAQAAALAAEAAARAAEAVAKVAEAITAAASADGLA